MQTQQTAFTVWTTQLHCVNNWTEFKRTAASVVKEAYLTHGIDWRLVLLATTGESRFSCEHG